VSSGNESKTLRDILEKALRVERFDLQIKPFVINGSTTEKDFFGYACLLLLVRIVLKFVFWVLDPRDYDFDNLKNVTAPS
jgi:hypothetical protein